MDLKLLYRRLYIAVKTIAERKRPMRDPDAIKAELGVITVGVLGAGSEGVLAAGSEGADGSSSPQSNSQNEVVVLHAPAKRTAGTPVGLSSS